MAPKNQVAASQKSKMTEQAFGQPTWKAQRVSSDNSVTITPCEPIELRLLDVRIPWDPSSFVEDSDRKNIFFELRDPTVRAYLQAQEEALSAEGWGAVNSCLAKEGLLRCKIGLKQVHVFDKDRHATDTPPKFAGLVCNVLVKLIGKWQTPDGSASGLNLQATDMQLLRLYERECPF